MNEEERVVYDKKSNHKLKQKSPVFSPLLFRVYVWFFHNFFSCFALHFHIIFITQIIRIDCWKVVLIPSIRMKVASYTLPTANWSRALGFDFFQVVYVRSFHFFSFALIPSTESSTASFQFWLHTLIFSNAVKKSFPFFLLLLPFLWLTIPMKSR